MNNSSILIVGAERGLGLGLAEFYLSRGWEVFATYYPGSDLASLEILSKSYPGQLSSAPIDVTDKTRIEPFINQIGVRKFDVIFMIAGIFGPLHQSVLQATDTEFQQIMMTNSFGPARLARHLIPTLSPQGTLCFMTSHRASIAANDEPGIGLELYRASKVALNMLARCIYMDIQSAGHTVLSIHPGWVATAMGTLDGAVEAEIDVKTSVEGMADVIEKHRHDNTHLYLDYENKTWPW
ncbi:SDR family oxidoreductase [Rouxiella silvae]|uniref:SDR family oxidoreductase n=1 Tax=Rouxiella silvae TaxID=1646373 RepID=A0AA41BVV8_9GAMM|nr:SDR family oxidoreductase [Rouxiella silvae]MBF6636224.1 SDR family oxidoreductase [Rouxiella silvae]